MPWNTQPDSFSLASVSPAGAIVTAAKVGSVVPDNLVLRVYQPSNRSLPVKHAVNPRAVRASTAGVDLPVTAVTALERPLPEGSANPANLTSDATSVSFTTTRAVTTLALGAGS